MTRSLLSLVVAALLASGCASNAASTADAGRGGGASTPSAVATTTLSRGRPTVTVPAGPVPTSLVVQDLIVGDGPEVTNGASVAVQYVGALWSTGKEFDASWDRGQPLPFRVGSGAVIPGWDRGILGMRLGGRRELIIPPGLAYGAQGHPPVIPPNATLVFVIDLVAIAP